MFKISRLADYSTVIMHHLLEHPHHFLSATVIAEKTQIAAPTVSKILKLLCESELVNSERGVNGGYQLAKHPEKISLADIIIATDGVPAITECSKEIHDCAHNGMCSLRGNWQYINRIIMNLLKNISLVDMSQSLVKLAKNEEIIMQFIPTKMKSIR